MIKEIRNHRSHLVSAASVVRTRVRAVVVDPEVVFVASLMKADAPSLVASFQCDVTLWAEDDGTQKLRANLRELKVLACPFIRNKEEKAVTTVRSHVGSWGVGDGEFAAITCQVTCQISQVGSHAMSKHVTWCHRGYMKGHVGSQRIRVDTSRVQRIAQSSL